MKKLVLCLTVSLILLSVVGCSTTTSQTVAIPDLTKQIANPKMGRIYVVRPTMYGGIAPINITDNGKLIGTTKGDGYLCWERLPGKAEISAQAENLSMVSLDVESSKTYYVCQHIKMGWVAARNTLEVVSEEKGKKFLKKCKPPVYGY